MSQSVTDPASDNHGKVIAFCVEELSVGGAENMLMLMANEFVERGWRVHMICLRQAGARCGEQPLVGSKPVDTCIAVIAKNTDYCD